MGFIAYTDFQIVGRCGTKIDKTATNVLVDLIRQLGGEYHHCYDDVCGYVRVIKLYETMNADISTYMKERAERRDPDNNVSRRITLMSNWMRNMVDEMGGDIPNLLDGFRNQSDSILEVFEWFWELEHERIVNPNGTHPSEGFMKKIVKLVKKVETILNECPATQHSSDLNPDPIERICIILGVVGLHLSTFSTFSSEVDVNSLFLKLSDLKLESKSSM